MTFFFISHITCSVPFCYVKTLDCNKHVNIDVCCTIRKRNMLSFVLFNFLKYRKDVILPYSKDTKAHVFKLSRTVLVNMLMAQSV